MSAPACIFVVDDDSAVLTAFERLLKSAGYDVRTFASPRDFLAAHDPDVPGCALLDVGMDDVDGLSVQDTLARAGARRPIVFVTGHDDVKTSVRAMKAGALDYLTKPVQDTALLAAVEAALATDRKSRAARVEIDAARRRIAQLTQRERQVMAQVVRDRLNKQIAHTLGIVEKTVKVHRARVMEKMGVRSVAALVHIAEQLPPSTLDGQDQGSCP